MAKRPSYNDLQTTLARAERDRNILEACASAIANTLLATATNTEGGKRPTALHYGARDSKVWVQVYAAHLDSPCGGYVAVLTSETSYWTYEYFDDWRTWVNSREYHGTREYQIEDSLLTQFREIARSISTERDRQLQEKSGARHGLE